MIDLHLRPAAGRLAAAAALALLALAAAACGGRADAARTGQRMIVLGFDGMDHAMVEKLMAEGRMPNLKRLAQQGTFAPLGTSVPPQSPVAWSDFITGQDSGGHGIFDFIHRKPGTMAPYFSTSEAVAGEHWTVGGCKIPKPWSSGEVELLRYGQPFWEVLTERGIETTIVRMPANFPPSGTATRELAGMGTPDLLGSPGTFSFYTSELFAFHGQELSGGEVYEIWEEDGVAVNTFLYGPDNPFLAAKKKLQAPFSLYVDPEEPVVKLGLEGEERILRQGEWSDWLPLRFTLDPGEGGLCRVLGLASPSLTGMVRFYLRQVRPELELYASPLNLDPMAPALPISSPPSYAAELARATGRFYTQGMPEDTKAFTQGIFALEEFLAQAEIAGDELIRQYDDVLSQFESGLLFYYFGNLDQVSHVLWHTLDPEHPAYDPERDPPFADVIPSLYQKLDGVVGRTLDAMGPDTTLIVLSDHGFTSWRRVFHLNAWLRDHGYLAVKNPDLTDDPGLFVNIDWSKTRAYGFGLNGLYLNLAGREKNGIVAAAEREALMAEIADRLLAEVDPATGQPAVTKVYRREAEYQDGGHREIGPDLVVGYAKGTRGGSDSAVGAVPPQVFTDNTEDWSGDHLMDHEAVPGVLLTSRPLRQPASRLQDLAAAILAEFGIEGFPQRN